MAYLPDFESFDAMPTLLFIKHNNIMYLAPSQDPLFFADRMNTMNAAIPS